MLSAYCFFFNDTATTEIYTLSLHDALPISQRQEAAVAGQAEAAGQAAFRLAEVLDRQVVRAGPREARRGDRKSTRLNSSHANISYAVFCLKKKKQPLYLFTNATSYLSRSS